MISFDFFPLTSTAYSLLGEIRFSHIFTIQLDTSSRSENTYSHSSLTLVQLLNSIRFHSRNYIGHIASVFIS